MPRPLLTAKDKSILLRLPSATLKRWTSEAKRARLTLSEWIRRAADAAITPPPA